MIKNDTFFKILFAIELALLPMVFFANRLLPEWTVGLIIAGILLAKIWLELFKDKNNRTHIIIDSIGSIAVFATIISYFIYLNLISKVLGIVVVVLIVAMNLLLPALFNNKMPEFIDAVDYCYMLFECFTLVALTFTRYYGLITNIGLFALLLTCAVSVAYKLYFVVRHSKIFNKIIKKR